MFQLFTSIILILLPSQTTMNGVTLNLAAKYQGVNLPLTGVGVESKVDTTFAVHQFFVEKPENFVRTENGAYKSLKNVGTLVMSTTFLQDTEASQVGLADMQSYEQQKVRDCVVGGGLIRAGETLSVIGDTRNGVILYQRGSEITSIYPIDPEAVYKTFSVWFGKTISSENNLKAQLLRKPPL